MRRILLREANRSCASLCLCKPPVGAARHARLRVRAARLGDAGPGANDLAVKQTAFVARQADVGVSVAEARRKMGISSIGPSLMDRSQQTMVAARMMVKTVPRGKRTRGPPAKAAIGF